MSSNPAGPSQQARSKERGLPALNEARRVRRRSIVFGKVRLREVATRFWLLTFAGMVLFGIIYYRHAQNELGTKRNQLAARQRAVAIAAGPAGLALRDKLEAWVLQLAGDTPEARISAQASLDEIANGPGIYVRARLADARAADSLRGAAARSVHDGFTSCLFIGRAADPANAGVVCNSRAQCGPGELCDDWGLCSVPGQPYNLRLLYDALKVQGPDWEQRLASSSDELQVRAMELELEDTAKHEVPAAVELIKRSKYFTVVLDEDPVSARPAPGADAGVESAQQRLLGADHLVRVGIWDIARSEMLLSMQVPVAGRFLELGKRLVAAPDALRARQRQANNCAAAVEVREALLARSGAPVSASEAVAAPKP